MDQDRLPVSLSPWFESELQMAKSPEEMAATMLANLPEKTGHELAYWVKLIGQSGHKKHGQIVKFLKADHGVTHGFANLIAHEFLNGSSPGSDPDLVDAQYSGGKEGLRPIYDKLIELVVGFGGDVDISPKKSYVSLRRSKQFALIQPSTKTRVDVGINLKGSAPTDRLEASGSFNSMVSHRVRLSGVEDVDTQLIEWLKSAYDAA